MEKYSPSGSTNDSLLIVQTALSLLRSLFKLEFLYRKAGILLSGLIPANERQLSLFDTGETKERDQLLLVMDSVNKRFGKETIKPGILGTGGKPWKLKQEHRSGRYTTCWDEIIEVNS